MSVTAIIALSGCVTSLIAKPVSVTALIALPGSITARIALLSSVTALTAVPGFLTAVIVLSGFDVANTELSLPGCSTFLLWPKSPPVGQGLLLIEVSRSYSDTPQLVGSLWTSDGPTQKPLPDDTQNSQETEIYAPGEVSFQIT